MTDNLVKEIGKLGIPAVKASEMGQAAAPSLAVEGHFLAIDEGNRARRMVIGFGAGASEVRTAVLAYEVTAEGRRLVNDSETTVKSSRKPGMGPRVGVGAAGRAVSSALLSGGVGVATAHGQTVEADARHAAEAIAKELQKLFAAQGWISR